MSMHVHVWDGWMDGWMDGRMVGYAYENSFLHTSQDLAVVLIIIIIIIQNSCRTFFHLTDAAETNPKSRPCPLNLITKNTK